MAFHVEVSSGLRHARAFNLSLEEVNRAVLGPWLSRRQLELGDRKWDPEESELRVLEGPELGNPELSFGQGWANAERSSQDVTRRVLADLLREREQAPRPAALVIETASAATTIAELTAAHGATPVDLETLRERTAADDPDVAAVIAVVQRRA